MDVTEGSMVNYLKGRVQPAWPKMIRFSQHLGVNILWLATGDGPMKGVDIETGIGPDLDNSIVEEVFKEKLDYFKDESKPMENRAEMFVRAYRFKMEERALENATKREDVKAG